MCYSHNNSLKYTLIFDSSIRLTHVLLQIPTALMEDLTVLLSAFCYMTEGPVMLLFLADVSIMNSLY